MSESEPDVTVVVKLNDAIVNKFGLEAYSEPKLKTPAQLEKMSGGRDFAKMWAYKPDAGLTLAAESDKRVEVRPNIERLRGPSTDIG